MTGQELAEKEAEWQKEREALSAEIGRFTTQLTWVEKNPSGQKRRLSRSDILREDCRMTGIRRRQTHENRPEVSPGQEAFLSS
jgi:hypothetical protein